MDKRSLTKEMMHGLAGTEDAEGLDEECERSFSKDTPIFCCGSLVAIVIQGICGLGRIDEIEDARQTQRLGFDSLSMVQTSDGMDK